MAEGMEIPTEMLCTDKLPENVSNENSNAGNIKAIDRGSVHKICSGQVVLTLATAVKELVENSVDAGATSVEVRLKEYGSEMIEVIDNGSGVEEINFEGLTLKHHTSKLQEFTDLISVETFGFRGEALSSLCALSQLAINTRHKSVSVGHKLEYDFSGKLTSKSPCARQVGTTVCLQNLFSTLPVRHKEFNRHLKKEFTKMVQVLNAYCIITTGVRINCSNQVGKGKRNVVVCTNGNATMRENVSNIFGAKQLQSLLGFQQISPTDEICEELGLKIPDHFHLIYRVTGFISTCCHGKGRSSTDRQFYFINQRPCDPTKVSKMVNEVYHTYNRHQYPFVALNIQLDKDHVDVNVTPDKRQIFVQEEKLLLAIIKSSLIKLFEPIHSVYQVNTGVGRTSLNLTSLFKRTDSQHSDSDMSDEVSNRSIYESAPSKPSRLSTLSNLKRSFSSAFSRQSDADVSKNVTPKKQPDKQRRLDSFVCQKSPKYSCPDLLSPASDSDKSTSISEQQTSTESGFSSSQDTCSSQKSSSSSDLEEKPLASENISSELSIIFENVTPDMKTDKHKLSVTKDDVDAGFVEINVEGCCSAQIETRDDPDCKMDPEDYCNFIKETGSQECLEYTEETKLTSSVVKDPEISDQLDSKIDFNTKELLTVDLTLPDSCKELSEEKDCNRLKDVSVTLLQYDNEETVSKKESTVAFSMEKLKQHLSKIAKREESVEFHRGFRAQISPSDNKSAEEELQKEIKKEMFAEMEILGQFNLGFIIARLKDDLFIIDQHATDEKFNFEMLQKNTVIQSQRMICPLNLELTACNEIILMDNLDIFKKNGFDFSIDDDAPPTQRVKLTSTPMSKNWTFGKEDIEEMLFMLSESPGVSCRPSRVRQMFASRSCRKAIMIGTALDMPQMKRLVQHMGEIEQPWNCPHGRPTMRHLINLRMIQR